MALVVDENSNATLSRFRFIIFCAGGKNGNKFDNSMQYDEICSEGALSWSFEKLEFSSLTNQKNWLYNTNNEQISNSKSLFVLNL